MLFADIILPLSTPKPLTYGVPEHLQDKVTEGLRVEVSFGRNKVYSGIIYRLHNDKPNAYQVKPLRKILDKSPIVSTLQIKFWEWIASYYCCNLGDVLQAALPAYLKLMNNSLLLWNDGVAAIPDGLSDEAFLLAEALQIKKRLTIDEAKLIVENENHTEAIIEILDWGLAIVEDELKEKYKPKKEKYITLSSAYFDNEQLLSDAFDSLKNAPKQLHLLTAFFQIRKKENDILLNDLLKMANSNQAAVNSLVKKGIFEIYEKEVSRLLFNGVTTEKKENLVLSVAQNVALESIREQWQQKSVVLLHGVTGSGKTMIYIKLIQEVIEKGKQVLFLLPEIALTTQLLSRLQDYFGNQLGVYHSRFSDNERVEIWEKVADGSFKVVLGARSAVWLPFQELGLLVIDEEHEVSYKQFEPAPRFHARDAGVYLAGLYGCRVVLGSATPSLESVFNVQSGKYGYTSLKNRYENFPVPEIEIIHAGNTQPALSSIISLPLLDEIQRTLSSGRQVLVFQNKRGYAPFIICAVCGHIPHCPDCDVSLTYHKYSDKLHCHYCGRKFAPVKNCSNCGSDKMITKSFGTERVEEDLIRIFPKKKIARMDTDSVKGKNRLKQIIKDFERGSIDILVGTQMIVKGLDFGNVGLAGILSADSLWSFPDFRVNERAFQLMLQLSGRVGRMKDNQGKVLIQAYNLKHPLLEWVKNQDYHNFYKQEIALRSQFGYPPFTKLIKLVLRHQKQEKVLSGAQILAEELLKIKEIHVQGPVPALVSRVRGSYIFEILIKLPRNKDLYFHKQQILEAIQNMKARRGYSVVNVVIDVDPG